MAAKVNRLARLNNSCALSLRLTGIGAVIFYTRLYSRSLRTGLAIISPAARHTLALSSKCLARSDKTGSADGTTKGALARQSTEGRERTMNLTLVRSAGTRI